VILFDLTADLRYNNIVIFKSDEEKSKLLHFYRESGC